MLLSYLVVELEETESAEQPVHQKFTQRTVLKNRVQKFKKDMHQRKEKFKDSWEEPKRHH